jgi:hypothetical protein
MKHKSRSKRRVSTPKSILRFHSIAVLSRRVLRSKKYNPGLRKVLLLYLGTVKTQRQFQVLSCKAAQGKDLPYVQYGLFDRKRWTDEADFRLREHQSS